MKRLQNLLLGTLAVMIIASCGASYQETKEKRAAEKAAERAAIVKALENADFILDVTQIIPHGYPSRMSSGEYQLRLKGDVVNTRLPFIGSSHEAQFGGVDELSIVFENEKVQVIKDFSAAATKGEYRYQFKGGKGKDTWTVTLQVFDSGSASINCSTTGGRFMNFFANLELPADGEN